MSAGAVAVTDRTWLGMLLRALIALVIGAAVTFSSDHSTALGFAVLGVFLAAWGVLAVAMVASGIGMPRPALLAIGVLSLAGAVVAFAAHGADAGVFALVGAVWAVATGAIEIAAGVRARSVEPATARDTLVSGILTAALGLVLAVVPRDPVLLVGLVGAYAVVLGVFVGIGAFTVRDARRRGIRAEEAS